MLDEKNIKSLHNEKEIIDDLLHIYVIGNSQIKAMVEHLISKFIKNYPEIAKYIKAKLLKWILQKEDRSWKYLENKKLLALSSREIPETYTKSDPMYPSSDEDYSSILLSRTFLEFHNSINNKTPINDLIIYLQIPLNNLKDYQINQLFDILKDNYEENLTTEEKNNILFDLIHTQMDDIKWSRIIIDPFFLLNGYVLGSFFRYPFVM